MSNIIGDMATGYQQDSNLDGEEAGSTAGLSRVEVGQKRKRSSIACKACNERKTKCDVSVTGLPCGKCQKSGRACEFLSTKRGKYDRTHLRAGSANVSTAASAASAPAVAPPAVMLNGDASTIPSPASTSSRNNTTYDNTDRPAILSGFDLLLSSSRDNSEEVNPSHDVDIPIEDMAPHTRGIASHVANGFAMPISYPSLGVPFPVNALGSTSYSQQETIDDPNEWTDLMALHPDRLQKNHTSQNVLFASDSWTLSHLLRQYWNSQPTNGVIPKRRVHFPGNPSFTPIASQHIQSQEMAELAYLAQVGCFTLPPKPVLDNLVAAYFAYFHPVYPILSKAKFDEQYSQVLTGGVPMLQLWGMLYVSCTLCEMRDLEHAGFSTRFEALKSFCMRGKALYNASFERDRVMAVLFEFHLSQVWSDGEDSNVWAARASSSAQSIGMHRSTADSKLVDADRHLWKRIWWAVYIRDRHSSAATGRPYRIHDDFSDIELPALEDFESEREHLFFLQNVLLAQLLTKLVEYRLSISKRNSVTGQEACHLAFTEWLENLPKSLSAGHASTDIFVAYLHISYHCWIIHLFRPESDAEDGSAIASQSAAAATRLFEDLLQQDKVGRSPQLIVTALFAAMAQHIHDRRSSNVTIKALSHHRLGICRMAAKELAAMRPVAAWFRRTFQSFDTHTPALEELPRPEIALGGGQAAHTFGDNTFLSDIFLSDSFWKTPNDGELDFDWLNRQLNAFGSGTASAEAN